MTYKGWIEIVPKRNDFLPVGSLIFLKERSDLYVRTSIDNGKRGTDSTYTVTKSSLEKYRFFVRSYPFKKSSHAKPLPLP